MKTCLVVGYGSIGKRHARILRELSCDISLVTQQTIEDYPCYLSITSAFKKNHFDYVVIANPTHNHYSSLLELISCDFFGVVLVEKPIFSKKEILPKHKFEKLLVAYNFRFNELLMKAKELVQNEKLLTFHAYVGQYLPTWRTGNHYSVCYSAKKEGGGGVLRDLSHELDYATWFCGSSLQLSSISGKISDLDINSDDVCSVLMKTEHCPCVTLHMNYLDRTPKRDIIINTNTKTVAMDLVDGILRVDGKVVLENSQAAQQSYYQQHQAILNGDYQYCCGFSEAMDVMSLIEKIESDSFLKINGSSFRYA